jgi:transposase IS116/IS110/IS902 family protein
VACSRSSIAPRQSPVRCAAELTARIEEQIAPYADAADRLDEIPGAGRTGAQELIAETGVDMTRFPDAAHLVSWAKFAPIDKNSAGKKKGASTGKGNPWPGATIGEIVSAAARTDTFLAERYQRIARRRGKRRAIVALGNSLLTIVWHLLADPAASYHDPGPGYTNHASTASAASAPSSASSNSSPARKSPSSQPPNPPPQRPTGTGDHQSLFAAAPPLLTIFESDIYH